MTSPSEPACCPECGQQRIDPEQPCACRENDRNEPQGERMRLFEPEPAQLPGQLFME